MNRREAEFILESVRAGMPDGEHPKVRQAFERMDSDPELAAWYASMTESDQALRTKLRDVPVPDFLLERIKSGGMLSGCDAAHNDSQVSSRDSRRRGFLKLAALVVGLGAVGSTLPWILKRKPGPGSFEAFREDMVHFLDETWDHTLDHAENELRGIEAWLGDHHADVVRGGMDIPPTLAGSRTFGCKVFGWNATSVTLICFMPQNTGSVVHLMILDRMALRSHPSASPERGRVGQWNTAGWTSEDKVYLALTRAESSKLNQCLS